MELNCIVNCYKTERLISSWQLPHTPASTSHRGNVTLSHNIRYVYFNLLKRVLIVKSSDYRSVFLADDHGGDSLHVLQPVGVKVHQELPHPGAHGGERELDWRCPTWSNSATEEKERETELLVPLYCWSPTTNRSLNRRASGLLTDSLLTWHGSEWRTAAQRPPEWKRPPSEELAEDWWRRWRLSVVPIQQPSQAPGERGDKALNDAARNGRAGNQASVAAFHRALFYLTCV